MKSVFLYDDYRKFLREHFEFLPKKGWGQKSKLAQFLGVNSTFITQVLSQDKSLTLEQAKKTATFINLNTLEEDYFLILVQIDRSGTNDLRLYFENKKKQAKSTSLKLSAQLNKDKNLSDIERSIFYSSRLYSSVHLYTSIGNGKTLAQIKERFNIEHHRALEIVNFLLNAALIKKIGDKFQIDKASTFIEKGSPFAMNHHSNWRVRSIEKIEALSEEELVYTGNYSLSKSDFQVIREKLVNNIKEVLEVVKASEAEELVNLNIDFYWQ